MLLREGDSGARHSAGAPPALTGCRWGEVVSLTWPEADLRAPTRRVQTGYSVRHKAGSGIAGQPSRHDKSETVIANGETADLWRAFPRVGTHRGARQFEGVTLHIAPFLRHHANTLDLRADNRDDVGPFSRHNDQPVRACR